MIVQTTAALIRLKPVWKDRSIFLGFKIRLMCSLDTSIFLYACESQHHPHSRASKKNTSRGNEVLPQDTTHLIQRPCYHQGSLFQDPADNWTTREPPDHHRETQTEVARTCLPSIRSGQNYFERQNAMGKKTRQTD